MKKNASDNEHNTLFQQAMRGVKPLTPSKTRVSLEKKTIPRPKLRKPKPPGPELFAFSDYETLEPVSSEALLFFAKPGLQHKVLRKLRQGQYNVEKKLDLHGMTSTEAKIALGEFLQTCKHQGIRHVLMIHGKGRDTQKPILKNRLNHWLRQTPQVLAFCSALAQDGSTGALYVLLKNQTGESTS